MLTTENATTHRTTHGPGTYDAASRLCAAWQWLEAQRRSAPEGADVWDIRWQAQKNPAYLTDLLHTLQAGEYRLSPLQLHGQGDDRKAVWSAQDALVLKWVALSIEDQLPLHPSCEHVRGHGGGRQSIEKLHTLLTGNADALEITGDTPPKKTAGYAWVCRTDIRGYYRNISKETLLNQVRQHVQDPVLTALINQYIHYTVEDGGTFHTPASGISRGCALSPLMGALHLVEMDEHFSNQKGIHYARYMDDIVILAKTRWSLRKHTKRLMQWFGAFGFEAHPEKTQIGRVQKGFDWMGAWLTSDGVTDIAPRAKANHREKVRRLYERLARVPNWLRHRRRQQVHARVSAYRKRWNIWAGSILLLLGAVGSPHSWGGYRYAAPVVISGFPLVIPADAQVGDTLSTGSVMSPGFSAGNMYSAVQVFQSVYAMGVGFEQGACYQDACLMLPSGDAAVRAYKSCPGVGFVARTVTGRVTVTEGLGKGTVLLDYSGKVLVKGQSAAPGSDFPMNVKTGPDSRFASNGPITVTGDWVLTEPLSNGKISCRTKDVAAPALSVGVGKPLTQKGGITVLGGLAATWDVPGYVTYWGSTFQSGGTVPDPIMHASCSLEQAGSKTIDFTSPLNPTTINNMADGKVIAKAPSSLDLSISCVGDMTGVQPVLELAWSNPVTMHGTNGLKIGAATEGDESSGILLSTTDAAVGASASCSPIPAGYTDWCEAYSISPGTPLTLYPVIFRNTNTTDKAKSGKHTVTGTLTLVTP
ncbi:UNVERIFIED_ORG: hypothetical protein M2414_005138 [Rahnella aquatilis]